MPSGSKKRKAAKKKKEKEAAHHHHHHPHSVDVHTHGDDDLKHQDDDKESDAEEVSSPVLQEHPSNHHQLTDGEKEEVNKAEDSSDVQASTEENKYFEGPKEDNEGSHMSIVEKQESETADAELRSKNMIVEDFEPQREPTSGVLVWSLDKENVSPIATDLKPASGEVSSKNEIELNSRTAVAENVPSRVEGNDRVSSPYVDEEDVVQIEIESKPDNDDLNNETEMVEPQKELTDEVLLRSIGEKSVETDPKPASDELSHNTVIMENSEPQKEASDGTRLQSLDQGSVAQVEADLKTIVEPESKVVTLEHAESRKETIDGDISQSQDQESHVIDKTLVAVDNSELVNSTEAVNPLPEGLTHVTNTIKGGDSHSSSLEARSADEKDKAQLSDKKINGNTSFSADRDKEMKENGGKKVILQEWNFKMSPAYADVRLDNREDATIVKTDDTVATASREIGENLTVSYNVPAIETANGADSSHIMNNVEHLKDPKSSDSQVPPGASGSRVVQRTSWMGCCGLFELFAGSNR